MKTRSSVLGDMRELPSPLRPLKLIVMEYPPLLLRRFHSTGDITSNPLERFSPRKTQAPFRQIRHKESCPTNTSRTMNCDMPSCLSVGDCLLNCLFQVVFSWHPKIWNR